MRTSSVISQLRKALKHAKEWASADTAYYESTLNNFKEMTSICSEIIDTLSGITRTDRPRSASTAEAVSEMQTAINKLTEQFNEKMADMQSQINALSDKVDNAKTITPSIVVSNSAPDPLESDDVEQVKTNIAEVVVSSSDPDTSTNITISSVTKKENSEYAKRAAKAYDSTLRNIATAKHQYVEVSELSQLLYDWHKKRFMDNYKYNCKFKYSYKRVRKLIYLITIAYGYHVEQKDIEQFKSMFRGFLDKIGSDPQTTDCFAVPYEINQLEKEYDHSYDTNTAVALYSVICDMGLYEMGARGGMPIDYRPSYGDVMGCFSAATDPYESVNQKAFDEAENNPESYLTNIEWS